MIVTNCATGTIAPYVPSTERPWNRQRAAHLYKRLKFGATFEEIEAALSLNPLDIIDNIINETLAEPIPTDPEWADWSLSSYGQDMIGEQAISQSYQLIDRWMTDMLTKGFKERLMLFWHNHFVTRIDDYGCPSYMYQYYKLLNTHALGNFKDFTHKMGTNPAMLMFLNGAQNSRFEPNENYARELFELFTLGESNGYTQKDIEETARALTGWVNVSEICAEINFAAFHFDQGEKTIFGQTGNWNYNELHDILFTERRNEIATHICTQIYTYFVSTEIDEDIIAEMATTFKANDFELTPVFRQLFKSEHFFDEANMNTKVKSPLDMVMNYMKEAKFPITDYYDEALGYNEVMINVYFICSQLGQELFNPINVAGWEGDRIWINNNILTGRWLTIDRFLGSTATDEALISTLIDLAKGISDNSSDPDFITQLIVDFMIPQGLQNPEDYAKATQAFKWEVPENYFQDGSWNLDWEVDIIGGQMYYLLRHISRIPEFQLS